MLSNPLMLKALFYITEKDREDMRTHQSNAAWGRSSAGFTEGACMDHRNALRDKLEEVIERERLTIGD